MMTLTQILPYIFFCNSIFPSSFLMRLLYYSEQQGKHIQESISVSEISYFHKNFIIPLLYQYGLFIPTCVSKNTILPKDVIFYLFWYYVIRWSSHIYKKPSFLSFHSLLFLVNNTGEAIESNWKMVTQVE